MGGSESCIQMWCCIDGRYSSLVSVLLGFIWLFDVGFVELNVIKDHAHYLSNSSCDWLQISGRSQNQK